MELNFRFRQCPRLRYLLNCHLVIVERWRPPGNGHTAALCEENDWPSNIDSLKKGTLDAQLHHAARQNIAMKGRIVAQSGHIEQSGLISHVCLFLSLDLLERCFRHKACVFLTREEIAAAISLHRVYGKT